MAEYHKYVFDAENRAFVGSFEEMYRADMIGRFDSWHQEDSRQLNRKIALDILGAYNFRSVLDIGVGKGALTHQLKRRNNHVLGLDVSPTAIQLARSRFSDIEFDVFDVNDVVSFGHYLDHRYPEGVIDLIFMAECLSYIENWRELVALLSRYSEFFLVTLYIPENPIGFVKTVDDLEAEISCHLDVLEMVLIKKSRFVVLFAQKKPAA